MNFITAFFKKEQEDLMFRSYTADCLKVLTENTGRGVNLRFMEVFENARRPKNNKSGEEIAADVIKKCGLVVKE